MLAGLWEFPSLLLEEEQSEKKQKGALRAEVSRILGAHSINGPLQYKGEVSGISINHIYICLQVKSF